ncbi:hypothetical protein JG688_00013732 [Phytophthora aleatoria]|uniref:Uncharacterized protein n=1 Tax=Phytophthora aleatoria TaxID=2496075 RepID=A0A8J5ID18_9STRA|nr:hypothetical protein JG688_00013732 [Phytophthora aleatoria]
MKAETSDALTRAGTLNKALRVAIVGAFDSTRRLPRGVCEEVTEKSAQSDVVSVDHSEAEHVSMPSSNTKKLRRSYENSSLSAIVLLKGRPSEETAIETAQTEDTMLDDEGDSGAVTGETVFMDSSANVGADMYCTPECCTLEAHCSDVPRPRQTLKLSDTDRVGLGVYTTVTMDIGDTVGEYAGELSESAAMVAGQPAQQ